MATIEDELLKSQLFLERLKGDSLEELRKRITIAEEKILTSINKTSNMTDKARYIELKKIITEQIKIAYEPYVDLVSNDMEKVAELSYNATNTILNTVAVAEGLKTYPKFNELNDSAIKRILDPNRPIVGKTLGDTKKFLTQSQTSRIKSAVVGGLVDGGGLAKTQRNALAVENMQNEFSKIRRNDLNTLVRTSMLQAIDDARYETYEQHNDLIVGWTYTATLDSRTSFQCASLDGTYYKKSAKYPNIESLPFKPKIHYNCRSLLVFETKTSLKEKDERPYAIHSKKTVNHRDDTTSTKFTVEKAGQVSGNTKYPEFFARQTAKFQRDYLGATRYELYKEGKLTFDSLVSRSKKPLTVEQILARI